MKDQPLSPDDERRLRWLDETLSDGERAKFEQERSTAADRTDLEREKGDLTALRRLLRQHVPTDLEPPYPDFFNSQVAKKIREGMAPVPARQRGALAMWLQWFRSPWAVAVAAALALLAVVLMDQPERRTRVLSVYSPEPNATAHAYYSKDVHAMVIELDGLEAYPAERQIAGNRTAENGALVATLTP